MIAIKTEKLCKKYGDLVAVNDLDLEIREGEIFALLGINGAGKSTTVKMLSCLVSPTSGDATVFGTSIRSRPYDVKRVIGLSPQSTAIAPNLTVEENLDLACGVYGLGKEEARIRKKELIDEFSLDEVLKRRASKLSGGWQRRLSIAFALVGRPNILFLDEPTLGLDVIARAELWDTVRALRGNTTVILTTHYMEEAEALCDRIGIMKDGRLIECGTCDELKAKAECDRFEDAFIKLVKEGGAK